MADEAVVREAGPLPDLIQPVPSAPLALDGLEVTVSYLPAESTTKVGGDWYHAQTLPDGRVVLAIGDVAGHGQEAASGMARLRSALVAWLSAGLRDPAELLDHLNRRCLQLGITGTALIGFYAPRTRELLWARAGHPPPLLHRSGTVTELERPPGLLLGAEPETVFPITRISLEPGDLLLFFTDGLVERRGLPAGRLAEVRDLLATAEVALLHTPSPDDDTCTLAVRVTG